ncbi:hypothetical protein J1N35_017855 [Gossypium stocksii]|uniref:Uncharacterized protein n=1 Tax=Gossypium stocksii TaxID=47602 RepID=A0A9D3VPS9_9ROSI|nr:hypothetical protein J1N35_017855 [Gossypium stocksii]
MKGVDEQNEPMKTCVRAKKTSRPKDILLTMEERVVNLEEYMRDMRETLEVVKGRTTKLDPMKEQLREMVLESLGSNVE